MLVSFGHSTGDGTDPDRAGVQAGYLGQEFLSRCQRRLHLVDAVHVQIVLGQHDPATRSRQRHPASSSWSCGATAPTISGVSVGTMTNTAALLLQRRCGDDGTASRRPSLRPVRRPPRPAAGPAARLPAAGWPTYPGPAAPRPAPPPPPTQRAPATPDGRVPAAPEPARV